MQFTRKQSSIILVLYILLSLGFRFWLEGQFMIGIIPSIAIGLLFILPIVYLWKKDIINPYREV